MHVLVTGGAGFIGSNLIPLLIREYGHSVVNVDCLTAAGNPRSLNDIRENPRYSFELVDLRDAREVRRVFTHHKPQAVVHLASENREPSRLIDGSRFYMETNFHGTFNLLEATREYLHNRHSAKWIYSGMDRTANPFYDTTPFRYLHVSTDEVFGSLEPCETAFTGDRLHDPRTPHAASKAASDLLTRAWWHTHGLPAITAICGNAYGPCQFPVNLIPRIILHCLRGEAIGYQHLHQDTRDWLHVDDLCRALADLLHNGQPGHTYLAGSGIPRRHIDLIRAICRLVDERAPNPGIPRHETLILPDPVHPEPGEGRLPPPTHRAVNPARLREELSWQPRIDFPDGLRSTVQWYLDNRPWWEQILSGDYKREHLRFNEFEGEDEDDD